MPHNATPLERLQIRLESLQVQYNYCDRMERFELQQEITDVKNKIHSLKIKLEKEMSDSKELIQLSDDAVKKSYELGETASIIDQVKSLVDTKRVYDMNNKKDQAALRTMAANISKAGSLVARIGADEMRSIKEKTAADVKRVGDAQKTYADEFKQLKEDTRKPLTEWEDIRKEVNNAIEKIVALRAVAGYSSEAIRANIDTLKGFENAELPEDKVNDFHTAYNSTQDVLDNALIVADKAVADQKELDDLREANAELERQAEIERLAAEKAEKIIENSPTPSVIVQATAQAPAPVQEEKPPENIPEEKSEEFVPDPDVEHQRQVHRGIISQLTQHANITEAAAKIIVGGIILGKIDNIQIKY